jgi:hypothetical protein
MSKDELNQMLGIFGADEKDLEVVLGQVLCAFEKSVYLRVARRVEG